MKGVQDDHYNLFLEYVIEDYELIKNALPVIAHTAKGNLTLRARLKYLESIIKLYKPEYFEPANKQS